MTCAVGVVEAEFPVTRDMGEPSAWPAGARGDAVVLLTEADFTGFRRAAKTSFNRAVEAKP